MIWRVLLLAGALVLSLPSVAATPTRPVSPPVAKALAKAPKVPGAIILVRRLGESDLAYTSGVRAFGGEPLRIDDEFRIASVSKTYVAAAALRLVEDGRLALSDPIATRLSSETTSALTAGGYAADKITVADLLSHRAGLRTHDTTAAFAEAVGANPGRRWTRADQIAIAIADGPPLSPPGKRFAYSDTGYVLVGEIIERVAGEPLATAIPRLLDFNRLGLQRTYWEPVPDGLLPAVPTNRAHAYQDKIDTAQFNPSFDTHGGGGLVSTGDDLLRFLEALVEGQLFREMATRDAMLAPALLPDPAGEGARYGLGVMQVQVGREACWGHDGHWGTRALWCPGKRGGYVITVNAAGKEAAAAFGALVKATDQMLLAR